MAISSPRECVLLLAALPSVIAFQGSAVQGSQQLRPCMRQAPQHQRCQAAMVLDDDDDGLLGVAAAAGLIANPVMWLSLYYVATTGGGLPAGPLGLVGALEGVSYLVVVGIVGAALINKKTTGSGLPAGPNSLLGAAEGLSFLSVIAGIAVLLLLASKQGCVPNALPLIDYSDQLPVCR